MSHTQLDELLERKNSLQSRIQEGIDELIEVIAQDVPTFLLREVRKRFIEALELVERFDSAAVAALKASIQTRGEAVAQQLRATLSDVEAWLSSDLPTTEGKSLTANKVVWSALQNIAAAIPELLKSADIPVSQEDVFEYQTPTMFIQGKYAPGLIETYWTRLAQLRLLNSEIEKRTAEHTRENLAKLWDEA